MAEATALRVAIDLLNVPSRVRLVRAEPLPAGIPMLLAIAAGDEAALAAAAELTGRSSRVVAQAAAFFIEQILLAPDADSYRVLGATRAASGSELRRNMALMLRWLHPDMHGDHSLFAARVTRAWEDLKTPERRAAYDQQAMVAGALKEPAPARAGRAGSRPGAHRVRRTVHYGSRPPHAQRVVHRAGLLRRALLFIFGRRMDR